MIVEPITETLTQCGLCIARLPMAQLILQDGVRPLCPECAAEYQQRKAADRPLVRKGTATAAEAALAQALAPKPTTRGVPAMNSTETEQQKREACLKAAAELAAKGADLKWGVIARKARQDSGLVIGQTYLAPSCNGGDLREQIQSMFKSLPQPVQDAPQQATTPVDDADHLKQQLEAARVRIAELEGALSEQPNPQSPAVAVTAFLEQQLEQDRVTLARIDAEIRQAQSDRQAVVAAIVAAETLMERASGESQAQRTLQLVKREGAA